MKKLFNTFIFERFTKNKSVKREFTDEDYAIANNNFTEFVSKKLKEANLKKEFLKDSPKYEYIKDIDFEKVLIDFRQFDSNTTGSITRYYYFKVNDVKQKFLTIEYNPIEEKIKAFSNNLSKIMIDVMFEIHAKIELDELKQYCYNANCEIANIECSYLLPSIVSLNVYDEYNVVSETIIFSFHDGISYKNRCLKIKKYINDKVMTCRE
ncbi:MAG: hypothetical protein ACRC5M_06965 [Anaeroplasmataceae bacterium]